jgi:segregation and condensation protein B
MNNPESLAAAQIEALLFALGRPLSRGELQKQLGLGADAVDSALAELAERRGGIRLVDDGREVELRVGPEGAAAVEKARKEEYSRDIGRAGLEALAAILYRGPLSRAEIDFIRGVNSSQTLRTLAMRGLVRRIPNPKDERQYLYEPTTELLSQLGAHSTRELPEYAQVREKLAALEEAYKKSQSENPA